MEAALRNVIALLLIGAGITFLVISIQSAESITSELSELFTGQPSDKSVWFFLLGIFLMICGLAQARGRRLVE